MGNSLWGTRSLTGVRGGGRLAERGNKLREFSPGNNNYSYATVSHQINPTSRRQPDVMVASGY